MNSDPSKSQLILNTDAKPTSNMVKEGLKHMMNDQVPKSEVIKMEEAGKEELAEDLIERKRIVGEILKLPITQDWKITDHSGNLCMVHFHDQADPTIYGYVRGVVIDVKHRVVVADSYGYTPTVVSDCLQVDTTGYVQLKDTDGKIHEVNLKTTPIHPGIEGMLIRVFRWEGRTYYASQRRFELSKSFWGDSPMFLDLYNSLGGPTDLFDEREKFSPFVHFFMIEHNSLLHVSKKPVGDGRLYYVGFRSMWQHMKIGEHPFKFSNLDGSPARLQGEETWTVESWKADPRPDAGYVNIYPTIPKSTRTSIPFKSENGNRIIVVNDLQISEANSILRHGYLKFDHIPSSGIDYRLGTGEFIVLYLPNGTLLRVESKAYSWRAYITDDNPNRGYQFYRLINYAHIKPQNGHHDRARWEEEMKQFRCLFPYMKHYDIKSVRAQLKQGPIYIWNDKPDISNRSTTPNLRRFQDRLHNIWACLLVASPHSRQLEIVDMFDNYFTNLTKLVNWIHDNQERIRTQDPEATIPLLTYTKQLKWLISRPVGKSFKNMVRKTLTFLSGEDLYRLIREMRKHERFEMNVKEEKEDDDENMKDEMKEQKEREKEEQQQEKEEQQQENEEQQQENEEQQQEKEEQEEQEKEKEEKEKENMKEQEEKEKEEEQEEKEKEKEEKEQEMNEQEKEEQEEDM
jgi:hypothetical protein